jgi:hypothetical protein
MDHDSFYLSEGRDVHSRIVLAITIGLALSACAGREPQPIATVQPQDANSDCATINAEIQANSSRAQVLASEQNTKSAWQTWLTMGAKSSADSDAASLQTRQQYLENLAAQRCAPPPAVVAAPPQLPKHAHVRPKPKAIPTPRPRPPESGQAPPLKPSVDWPPPPPPPPPGN